MRWIGDIVKILFVCTGNVDRSPTAEKMFINIEGVEAKSAGTSLLAATRLSKELIEWADKVFVMENRHQKAVLKLDTDAREKIEVLDIPDIYYYNQPELKEQLKKKLKRFFKI
jgi:predicted protein tyrosine phosphatase